MTNFDLISEAINFINGNNNEKAIARLNQFVALNTPKVKSAGKLKLYDWVSKEEYRRNLMGVFHDAENKVAVATDTHVLLVSKPDYNEAHAGKIIDKNGDEIGLKFVSYQRVFPKQLVDFAVDRDKIAEMLTKIKAERKIDKKVQYKALNVGTQEEPIYMSPSVCKLLLTLPEGKFYKHATHITAPLTFESADGNYKALLMPVYCPDENRDMVKVGE